MATILSGVSSLIRNLAAVVIWLRMKGAYKRGNIELARAFYNQFAKLRRPNLHHRAFDATISILERNSDLASEKFRSVLEDIRASEGMDNNTKYIHHYSNYYIKLINKDPTASTEFKDALASNPSEFIQKSLRLPSVDFSFEEHSR